jgi:hypothetical protein
MHLKESKYAERKLRNAKKENIDNYQVYLSARCLVI